MMESTMSEFVGVWFMIILGAIGMAVVLACFWLIIELAVLIKKAIKENAELEEGSEDENNNDGCI